MKTSIEKVLNILKQKDYTDKNLIAKFENRLKLDIPLLRQENSTDHFCVFFIPIHKESNSIFMGHHIKANLWIPPGGHIDANETPIITVIREVSEELQYFAKPEDLELFNLSTIDISNNPVCSKHWDLYYLLNMKEMINFPYEKREFSDAKWMDIKEANDLMQKHQSYKNALKPLLTK